MGKKKERKRGVRPQAYPRWRFNAYEGMVVAKQKKERIGVYPTFISIKPLIPGRSRVMEWTDFLVKLNTGQIVSVDWEQWDRVQEGNYAILYEDMLETYFFVVAMVAIVVGLMLVVLIGVSLPA